MGVVAGRGAQWSRRIQKRPDSHCLSGFGSQLTGGSPSVKDVSTTVNFVALHVTEDERFVACEANKKVQGQTSLSGLKCFDPGVPLI